jgi:uncharacterized protein involved in exopolysaccharide biosynthesis
MDTKPEFLSPSGQGVWGTRANILPNGGDLLEIVRRRIGLILACIAVFAGVAIIYVYSVTPRYTAQVAILLESKGGSILDVGDDRK